MGVPVYQKTLLAGWADVDANGHMRNVAFLDKAVDLRLLFFAEHGFPVEAFATRAVGPVVMKDEVQYFREVGLLESFTGTLALAGMADDGSRFRLRNEFFRADGKLAGRLTSTGGWLDLKARRLIAPPGPLLEALRLLPKTDDYAVLPSSLK
jgi:acyl-CoA thioester hydrolase